MYHLREGVRMDISFSDLGDALLASEPGDVLLIEAEKRIAIGYSYERIPVMLYAGILMRSHDYLFISQVTNDESALTTTPHTTYAFGTKQLTLSFKDPHVTLLGDRNIVLRKGSRADLLDLFVLGTTCAGTA